MDEPVKNTRIGYLVQEFARRTTSHGVARIAASNTRFRKTAWILVVLGAFTGYSIHVGTLVARYLRYDVAVKIDVMSEDSVTFPAVTVCNSNKLRLSAILNSTYKDLAKVNEPRFSFTYRGPCMPGDMSCDDDSTICIKQYMWCNGIVDCPNAIDELDCQHGNCLSNQYKCDNGKCLPLSLQCNYRDECGDNSDELWGGSCFIRGCVQGEYECESRECIPEYKLCDGHIGDCADGTDEPDDCTLYRAGFCVYDITKGFRCVGQPLQGLPCYGGQIRSCHTSWQLDNMCIQSYDVCNGVVDCIDGSDELIGCEDHYWKCPYNHFKCATGHCIMNALTCDGVMDCKDGSDELGCGDYIFSEDGRWTCEDNLTTIPISLRCNGFPNCRNGSDEVGCETYECPSTMMKCESSNICIAESKMCDGSNDCVVLGVPGIFDLSDEENCHQGICSSDRYRCGNGQCIDMRHRCDYHYHCLDHSDEFNCKQDDCPVNTILCERNSGDGQYCLDNTHVCDSIYDCYRDEDEQCSNHTCASSTFLCGLSCALLERRCNMVSDCPGGTDEVNCENHMCPDDSYFRCRSGQCIPWYLYCDEPIRPDCADGSDELFCNHTCMHDEFQCSSGWCINATWKCDGVNDCGDHSDEDNCPQFCTEDQYACAAGFHDGQRVIIQCIPGDRQCDRFVECYYGDDEDGCKYYVHDVTAEPNWYAGYLDISDDPNLYEDFRKDVFVNRPIDFIPRRQPPLWEHFLVASMTPDFSDLKHVLHLRPDEIRDLGHQREDLILQCSYDQRDCATSDFYNFQDNVYGNCYTFNHGNDGSDLKRATNTGSEYGLKLTLFTEQSEYISIFGQESGVRFMVHDPFTTPFLGDMGIDAKTGTATSVIIKQREEKRASPPWGNCTDKAYVDSGEYHYSLLACQKDCLHTRMYEKCGCLYFFSNHKPACDVQNKTQDACVQLMYYFYQKGKLGCDCQQPCSITEYQKMLSLTSWPSRPFSPRLLSSLLAVNPKVRTISDQDDNGISMNLARVKIYFESLNFERVSEVEDYPFNQLMADVGGALGLWVGLSIITVIEFGEFVYEMLRTLSQNPTQSTNYPVK
ncbi:uncharacterized protein LOC144349923 [Saccoglossus kowalevskii]